MLTGEGDEIIIAVHAPPLQHIASPFHILLACVVGIRGRVPGIAEGRAVFEADGAGHQASVRLHAREIAPFRIVEVRDVADHDTFRICKGVDRDGAYLEFVPLLDAHEDIFVLASFQHGVDVGSGRVSGMDIRDERLEGDSRFPEKIIFGFLCGLCRAGAGQEQDKRKRKAKASPESGHDDLLWSAASGCGVSALRAASARVPWGNPGGARALRHT